MLVWGCIAPHGGELIEELAGDNLPRMAATRAAIQELGRRCRAARPDTIVVYTPHGVTKEGFISLSVTERAEGCLDGENGSRVSVCFEVDRELALLIGLQADALCVPVAQGIFDTDGTIVKSFPLDWGALIPLWFMGAGWSDPPQIVVACPSRILPRQDLIDFGVATAEAAALSGKRVALICSADQGHGHDSAGPYGFSSVSAEYDAAYCAAVREDRLSSLLAWDDAWIKDALTDSFWQTLMLHGASTHTPLVPELLSYEAPTYFGMACAEFHP